MENLECFQIFFQPLLVAAIPPRLAFAPGSTGKWRPVSRMYELRSSRVTPAWTTQVWSPSFTDTMLFIFDKSLILAQLNFHFESFAVFAEPSYCAGIFVLRNNTPFKSRPGAISYYWIWVWTIVPKFPRLVEYPNLSSRFLCTNLQYSQHLLSILELQ